MISKENKKILQLFYKNKQDFNDFIKLHNYAIHSGIEDIFISLNIIITQRILNHNSNDSDGSFDHTSIMLISPMDLPNPKDMTITLVHELGHFLEEKVTPLKITHEVQILRDKDHYGKINNMQLKKIYKQEVRAWDFAKQVLIYLKLYKRLKKEFHESKTNSLKTYKPT